MIAFASSFPGSIRGGARSPLTSPVVVQKCGFLASECGVELSVFFQKKMGAGFFGGEGFIMQKLVRPGYGLFGDRRLARWSTTWRRASSMVVDTGNLAMMDATCSMDVQTVKGVKNMSLRWRGDVPSPWSPGRAGWCLQTMPISGVAAAFDPLPAHWK